MIAKENYSTDPLIKDAYETAKNYISVYKFALNESFNEENLVSTRIGETIFAAKESNIISNIMINVINDHKSLLKLEKVNKNLRETAKKVLKSRMSPSAPFHWGRKKKLAFKLEKELLQQLLPLLDAHRL